MPKIAGRIAGLWSFKIAAVVAAEITGEEQAVALFTKEGVRGERMWLIKPEGKPWVVPEGTTVTCPVSKEKFGAGEPVMRGHYYEATSRNDPTLFEYRPDLGLFVVPAAMLRAGGKQDPIKLASHPMRASRTSRQRELFKLACECKTRIDYLIEHIYKDSES